MENQKTTVLESNFPVQDTGGNSPRFPIGICILFLVSGSSGLIYEVVWLRMLSRTLGSTAYATSTILAVFMAGLALGSFLFGRYADRVRRPLVLYAVLEAGIGLTAILSLGMNSWPQPLYHAIYAFAGDSRPILTLGQILLAAAALLVPTTLMGATLPTLCVYGIRRFDSMGRVAGTLYSLNTLGAMIGVLVGGFLLIGEIGETGTVLFGASINLIVAAIALFGFGKDSVSEMVDEGKKSATTGDGNAHSIDADVDPGVRIDGDHDGRIQTPVSDLASRRIRLVVMICFAISGFISLALENVWSRMLALYDGTSVYAFCAMLAVMLAGIGVGGWFGGRVEKWKDPLHVLARLEIGVGLASAMGLAAFALMDHRYRMLSPLIIVGPSAFLQGIAFPVAIRCYVDHARAVGQRVGELYAWNTVGCILGSLLGGFFLVPMLGVTHTGAAMTVIVALSGVALLAVHPTGIKKAGLIDITLLIAVLLTAFSIGDPYRDVIFNRLFKANPNNVVFDHVEEATATATAFGVPEKPRVRGLLVNGFGMTVLITGNKLMAHLPLWLSDSPRESTVICMGMATTFRSDTRHPQVNVTVVEIVPSVTRFMQYYHTDAAEVLAQPNAHVVADDGRNYLLMHEHQVDTITIDPAPPIFSAGTVNLYSREFFDLCARRIKPGGAVCLWLPPSPRSEAKMVLRSFAEAFPNVSVWAGPTYPGFYLIGTLRPVNDVEARIRKGFTDPVIVKDLVEWDRSCESPEKVLGLYLCDRETLLKFTSDRPAVTDDHPYTEFPIWRLMDSSVPDSKDLDVPGFRKWQHEQK